MNTRTTKRIRRFLSIVGVLAILSTLIVVPTASAYTGADAPTYATTFVDDACDLGLIDCDRADPGFAKAVDRATGYQMLTAGFEVLSETARSPFTDVAGEWWESAANTAYTLGWTNGTSEGVFGGSGVFARQQMCVALDSLLGLDSDGADLSTYPDGEDISSWAVDEVGRCVEAGLMGGGTNLNAKGPVNKVDAIIMMVNAANYADENEVDVVEVAASSFGVSVDDVLDALDFGGYFVDGELVFADEEEGEEEGEVEEGEEEGEVEEGEVEEGEEETPPAVVGGDLTVAVGANTPVENSTIVAGQAIAHLADFVFTNSGSTDTKVTGLKLKREGVSADTTLPRVYLYDGRTRLTDDASVSDGVISWNLSDGLFTIPAGGSKTISTRSDIAASTNGQTIKIALLANEDVTSNAGAVTGTPVRGNTVTIASATLATFALGNDTATNPSANTSLDPQDDFKAWQNTVTIGQREVNVYSMNFRVIGSIVLSDLENFKLLIDGVQVGETVVNADSNGYVLFDLGTTPKMLQTGSRVIKVHVDIKGGSSRNFQVSLRKAADILVEDTDYGAQVLATGNGTTTTATFAAHTAGLQTVSSGTLTIAKKSDSPSGNVVNNGSGVTLGEFTLKALGENMKVENLRVAVVDSGGGTAFTLRNGALRVNSGKAGEETAFTQVGSTASLAATTQTGTGLTYTEYSLGSSLIVKPGEDRVLRVIADVFDDNGTNNVTAGSTLTARIAVGSTNVQAMISAGYSSVPAAVVDANALTVATGVLSLAKDQSYLNNTIVAPKSNYLLGKWSLTAGTTEGVNINTFTVTLAVADAFAVTDLNSLYIKYGDSTTSQKATGAASQSWSVSKELAAGASLNIELYGDIASGATDGAGAADTVIPSLLVVGTTSASATAVNTNSNTALAGQTVTAANTGTLAVSKDSGTPLSAIVIPGTTSANGALKVNLTSANEDVYIKELTFRQNVNADDVAVSGAYLYVAHGSETAAQTGIFKTFNIDGTNPGYLNWTFSGADRIKVTKDSSSYLILKPTYTSSQNNTGISGLTPQFVVTEILAEGQAAIVPSVTDDTSTTATTLLSANTDSGCNVNDAATILAAATTITFDNGGVGTCASATNIPVGTVIVLGTEEMLVTANSGTVLTVTRAFNSTTAAIHLDDVVINWKAALTSDVTQNSFPVTNIGTTIAVGDTINVGVNGTSNELMVVTALNLNQAGGAIDLISVVRESGSNAIAHAVGVAVDGGFKGNAMTVYRTAPTFTVHASSPTGSAQGGSEREVLRFTVAAVNNASDPGQDKVTLTSVDVTVAKSGVSVNNIRIYPSEGAYDQNATYRTTCNAESQTKWLCTLNTTSATNEIVENTSRTFVVRADVGSGAGATNSLEASIASLGTSGSAGDVVWSDQTTGSLTWVDQGTSQVKAASALTYGASSGTNDGVGPVISTVVIADAAEDNNLAIGDTITITFDERIDPTTIAATLLPNATNVAIANGATGDISANTAADDELIIANIITLTVGNTTFATGALTAANNAQLDATGTILLLTITTALTGSGEAGAAQAIKAASGGTTVKDVNNNAMTATGSNSAVVTSDAI